MSFISGTLYFIYQNNIYSHFQVITVKAVGGGNVDVTFTDASILTMTVAEAKVIFQIE